MDEKQAIPPTKEGAEIAPSPPRTGSVTHDERKEILKHENPYYAEFASRGEEWRKQYEKKFVRKVDWRLMPLLILMYLNNFLDRASLAQARLGTLEADLGESLLHPHYHDPICFEELD